MKSKKLALASYPLSYKGVNAATPPNFVIYDFAPESDFYKEFSLGTLWLVYPGKELYMLTDINGVVADWVQIYPSSTEGVLDFITDSGTAEPKFNVLRVKGGDDMITYGEYNKIEIKMYDNIEIDNLSIPSLEPGVVNISDTGLLSTTDGSAGQVLIASDDPLPASWQHFDSSDGSIVFTFDDNYIDMRMAAGSGIYLNALESDTTNRAIPITDGVVNISGDGNYITSAANFNEITIDLNDSIDIPGNLTVNAFGYGALFSDAAGLVSSVNGSSGQVIIGATGAPPIWSDLSSSDGSIIVNKDPNYIDLRIVGGSGSGSLDQLNADTGDGASPDIDGNILISGGENINTTASANVITVNLDRSINQPLTDSSGSQGLFSLDDIDFMHAYGTRNSFLGRNAGRRDVVIGDDNTGVGVDALKNLEQYGNNNAAFGHLAADTLTTNDSCTSIGALVSQGNTSTLVGFDLIYGDSLVVGNDTLGIQTVIGSDSGRRYVVGTESLVIGHNSYTSKDGNTPKSIAIGHGISAPDLPVDPNPSHAVAIGNDAANNQIWIGESGSGDFQQNKCHIAGIYGNPIVGRAVFVNNNDQLGYNSGWNSTGRLLIGTNPLWGLVSDYPFDYLDVVAVSTGRGDSEGKIFAFANDNDAPVLSFSEDGRIWDERKFTKAYLGGVPVSLDRNKITCSSRYFSGGYDPYEVWVGMSGPDDPKVLKITKNGDDIFVTPLEFFYDKGDVYAISREAVATSTGVYNHSGTSYGGPGITDFVYINDYFSSTYSHVGIKNNEIYKSDYSVSPVTWSLVLSAANNFTSIHMGHSASSDPIIAVGDNGIMYRSTDFGDTWTSIDGSFGSTNINKVFFNIFEYKWYAFGDSGKIASSDDEGLGLNWQQETNKFGTNNVINGTVFLGNSRQVLAFSDNPLMASRMFVESYHLLGDIVSENNSINIARSSSNIDLTVNTVMTTKPAFMIYQHTAVNDVTGDGTMYPLFSDSANYTKIVDNYNNFATNGVYTVPIDHAGKYLMYVSVNLGDLDYVPPDPPPPPEPEPGCDDPLIIETTNRSYILYNPEIRMVDRMTFYFQVVTSLDEGDEVTFRFGTYLEVKDGNALRYMDILPGTFCAGYKL